MALYVPPNTSLDKLSMARCTVCDWSFKSSLMSDSQARRHAHTTGHRVLVNTIYEKGTSIHALSKYGI